MVNVINTKDPTSYVLGRKDPPRVWTRSRAPLISDRGIYNIGDLWIDTVADTPYILVDQGGGIANWVSFSAAASLIQLTGDAGGAVAPVAGNINIQGGAAGAIQFANGGAGQLDAQVLVDGVTITIVGNQLVAAAGLADTYPVDNGGPGVPLLGAQSFLGSTSVDFPNASGIETHVGATANEIYLENRRFVSAYIVDSSAVVGLRGEYTTIQAAITAAAASGRGTVYIRPGTYTENITLTANIDLVGLSADGFSNLVVLDGTITANHTGVVSIRNMSISPAAGVCITSAAGNPELIFVDCIFEPAVATIYSSANANMDMQFFKCELVSPVAANLMGPTAGAFLLVNCATVNNGTILLANGTSNFTIFSCNIEHPIQTLGTAQVVVQNSFLQSGATETFNVNSVGSRIFVTNTSIDCSAASTNFAIGTGSFIYPNVALLSAATNIAGTLTQNFVDWKPYGSTTNVGVNRYNPADFTVNAATGEVSATGASPITGTTTTVGAVTADVLTIPAGAVAGMYQLECEVSAFEATGPSGGWYSMSGGFRTTGAATTQVGTADRENGEDAPLAAANVTYVAAGNNMIVRVLGVAGLTIEWSAEAFAIFAS